ncbi:unnamed protein product [Arabis nemorensis]|uniref:Uncharacterized protein n=1 Tax=Arabis nemorensis TaxID=586526 RepID=A0A565CPB4_9BRAS|nr:unnamed protein product [Arabis nemorensis]
MPDRQDPLRPRDLLAMSTGGGGIRRVYTNPVVSQHPEPLLKDMERLRLGENLLHRPFGIRCSAFCEG